MYVSGVYGVESVEYIISYFHGHLLKVSTNTGHFCWLMPHGFLSI